MKKEDLEFIKKIAKEVDDWPEWKKETFGFWGTAEDYEKSDSQKNDDPRDEEIKKLIKI